MGHPASAAWTLDFVPVAAGLSTARTVKLSASVEMTELVPGKSQSKAEYLCRYLLHGRTVLRTRTALFRAENNQGLPPHLLGVCSSHSMTPVLKDLRCSLLYPVSRAVVRSWVSSRDRRLAHTKSRSRPSVSQHHQYCISPSEVWCGASAADFTYAPCSKGSFCKPIRSTAVLRS